MFINKYRTEVILGEEEGRGEIRRRKKREKKSGGDWSASRLSCITARDKYFLPVMRKVKWVTLYDGQKYLCHSQKRNSVFPAIFHSLQGPRERGTNVGVIGILLLFLHSYSVYNNYDVSNTNLITCI